MSKKDYVAIARAYRSVWYDHEFKYFTTEHMFRTLVDKLADVLQADNEKFDREVFLSVVYGSVIRKGIGA